MAPQEKENKTPKKPSPSYPHRIISPLSPLPPPSFLFRGLFLREVPHPLDSVGEIAKGLQLRALQRTHEFELPRPGPGDAGGIAVVLLLSCGSRKLNELQTTAFAQVGDVQDMFADKRVIVHRHFQVDFIHVRRKWRHYGARRGRRAVARNPLVFISIGSRFLIIIFLK